MAESTRAFKRLQKIVQCERSHRQFLKILSHFAAKRFLRVSYIFNVGSVELISFLKGLPNYIVRCESK